MLQFNIQVNECIGAIEFSSGAFFAGDKIFLLIQRSGIQLQLELQTELRTMERTVRQEYLDC